MTVYGPKLTFSRTVGPVEIDPSLRQSEDRVRVCVYGRGTYHSHIARRRVAAGLCAPSHAVGVHMEVVEQRE